MKSKVRLDVPKIIAIASALVFASFVPALFVAPAHAAITITISDSASCGSIGGTWSSGTCTLSGYYEVTSGTTLEIPSGTTLDLACSGTCISVDSGGSLTVNDRGAIDMGSTVGPGIYNSGAITNSGTIDIANDQNIGLDNYGSVDNSGTIDVANTGGIGIEDDGAGTIANLGSIDVANTGDTGSIGIDNLGTIYTYGTTTNYGSVDNSGMINIVVGIFTNYGSVSNYGAISNSGVFNEECGAILAGTSVLGGVSAHACGPVFSGMQSALSSIQASLSDLSTSLSDDFDSLSKSISALSTTITNDFNSLSSAIANIGATGPTVGTINDASVESVAANSMPSFSQSSADWTQVGTASSDEVASGFSVSVSHGSVTNGILYISTTSAPGSAASTYAIPIGDLPNGVSPVNGQLRFPFSIPAGSAVFVQVVSASKARVTVQLQLVDLPIVGLTTTK